MVVDHNHNVHVVAVVDIHDKAVLVVQVVVVAVELMVVFVDLDPVAEKKSGIYEHLKIKIFKYLHLNVKNSLAVKAAVMVVKQLLVVQFELVYLVEHLDVVQMDVVVLMVVVPITHKKLLFVQFSCFFSVCINKISFKLPAIVDLELDLAEFVVVLLVLPNLVAVDPGAVVMHVFALVVPVNVVYLQLNVELLDVFELVVELVSVAEMNDLTKKNNIFEFEYAVFKIVISIIYYKFTGCGWECGIAFGGPAFRKFGCGGTAAVSFCEGGGA